MKAFLFILILASALTAEASLHGRRFDCGNTHNEWFSEYVYLNSPDEYDGPGRVDSCRKLRSSITALKNAGFYYICHATLN